MNGICNFYSEKHKVMRKNISVGLASIAIMVLAACAKETGVSLPAETSEKTVYTFEAVQADNSQPSEDGQTKTVIVDQTAVFWSPGDAISIFYGESKGKFTSTNTEPVAKTTFSGTFDSFGGGINIGIDPTPFWAVYPYQENGDCDGNSVKVTVPFAQVASAGTFAPEVFPAIAKSPNTALAFYNLCGGVMFTVSQSGIASVRLSGNNDEILAGTVRVGMDEGGKPVVTSVVDGRKTIIVNAPDEGTFSIGTQYYITSLPVNFSDGFTLKYRKVDSEANFSTPNNITIERSSFGKVENKDNGLTFNPAPILLNGSNCFIASTYSTYCIDCTKKGNSSEPVGKVASAEVLWESFGTDSAPTTGDIVSDISLNTEESTVSFKANADGNALIAVKDASGEILWSWHIWVCKDYNPTAENQHVYKNNAGIVMDRNLGATSATPGNVGAIGLMYQWGRKDPFMGRSGIIANDLAISTPSPWSNVESSPTVGTIPYATAHPTTFIKYNQYDFRDWDWLYNKNDALWQENRKSVYDPCPKGWRVPDTTIWSEAFGSSDIDDIKSYDSQKNGMHFGKDSTESLGISDEIWYPVTGYRSGSGSYFTDMYNDGYYWSARIGSDNPYGLYFCGNYKKIKVGYISAYRSNACAVRCVKE